MLRPLLDVLAVLLLLGGVAFFIAGTVGFYRFPDVFTRLHTLPKADALGVGLIAIGLALLADSVVSALKLLLAWQLLLAASVVGSHVIAHTALKEGLKPWRHDDGEAPDGT